jgi:DNA-binding transcriptional LysR family regulator
MDTLDAMRVFVAVVERNGFSAAAQALDMSTAGVTRQVAALEKRLSTRLLHRTTRRVSPTSAGAAYYAQCVRLLAEFDALEASIGAQALEPSGLLRINAPVSWGIARLGPLLAGFRERFPQVELDLALSDRLVDMVEEGYDVAIRITREPGPTLIARRLGESRISLCAAPSYLAAHGTPATPQALQDHACLGYSYWAGGDQWPLHGPGGDVQVTVNSVLRGCDSFMTRFMAWPRPQRKSTSVNGMPQSCSSLRNCSATTATLCTMCMTCSWRVTCTTGMTCAWWVTGLCWKT